MDACEVIILDVRVPCTPVARLNNHRACVNGIAWAPHRFVAVIRNDYILYLKLCNNYFVLVRVIYVQLVMTIRHLFGIYNKCREL